MYSSLGENTVILLLGGVLLLLVVYLGALTCKEASRLPINKQEEQKERVHTWAE